MGFTPVQDLTDGQVSPQERFRAMLMKMLQRKKSISPNPADGFQSELGKSLSDAEGLGVTTAPGAGNQN